MDLVINFVMKWFGYFSGVFNIINLSCMGVYSEMSLDVILCCGEGRPRSLIVLNCRSSRTMNSSWVQPVCALGQVHAENLRA